MSWLLALTLLTPSQAAEPAAGERLDISLSTFPEVSVGVWTFASLEPGAVFEATLPLAASTAWELRVEVGDRSAHGVEGRLVGITLSAVIEEVTTRPDGTLERERVGSPRVLTLANREAWIHQSGRVKVKPWWRKDRFIDKGFKLSLLPHFEPERLE